MGTSVDKGLDRKIGLTDDEDGHACDLMGHVIAVCCYLIAASYAYPFLCEYGLTLTIQERARVMHFGGNGASVLEGTLGSFLQPLKHRIQSQILMRAKHNPRRSTWLIQP